MSVKHEKAIVDAVVLDETYVGALKDVPEAQRKDVEATLSGFARLLGSMVEAVEKLNSDEVAQAVATRLAEKLRGG